MAIFQIWNAPAPTTAAIVPVTSGTAIKTMLQVAPSQTLGMRIIEWGWMCSAPGSAALAKVELLSTGTVAATVTAHVAAGIVRVDPAAAQGGDPTTNLIRVGTALTGYTSAAEGTITESKVFDAILDTIPTTNGYHFKKQFPLGREPYVIPSDILRIRNTMDVAVNVLCYVTVEV